MRILFRLVLLLFLANPTMAQVNSIGPITTYRKTIGGISGKTATATFDIQAYSDDIIRVRISQGNQTSHFSYALTSNNEPHFKAEVTDHPGSVEIATRDLVVVVNKAPFLGVSFRTRTGAILNEDQTGNGFGTAFSGNRVTSYKKLQEGERFVGLGEALGNLDKRGTGITLNNTDNYKYGDPRLPMYISIPFFIGIHHGMQYGLFYNNSYKMFFNFGLSTPFTSYSAEGGDADYFLIYGNTIPEILSGYCSLTGKMPMPPKWALGFHQSRCSYYPEERVLTVAETFRRKQIPVDCIVLDADYLQDYEPFRINKERFPDMKGMADTLRKMDIELTASVNPGIKIDSSYEAHIDGLKKDIFVKYQDGTNWVSDIAPSTNHFVDFTNPKGRQWWIDKLKFLPENGIYGYWNDMNEPAVNGTYLPDNLLFDFDGKKASAMEAKNLYGFQMARSSFESGLKYGNGRRPFVLTRSAFAGVQRYAAVWSGDNTAKDEYLLLGTLLNCQMGLSGLPFVGPDLGGYIGDGSKDLFRRWIEVGIFSPFVRNHKEYFATANEPWSYGEEVEAICKAYIGFRYRLMPYIYSNFYQATQTGMPIARSLCINYPSDPKVYDPVYQYQFQFGSSFLVVPVTSTENLKKVYLPEGDWYDLFTDELQTGKREFVKENPAYSIPVYVKSSSIIPMQSIVQSTKQQPSDTLYLHVYSGHDKGEFIYYEDQGDGFDYQRGVFCKRTIVYDPGQKKLTLSAQEGSFPSTFKTIKLILHGFGEDIKAVGINGREQPLQSCRIRLLDGLQYMGDYYDKGLMKSLRGAEPSRSQKYVVTDNSSEAMTIDLK